MNSISPNSRSVLSFPSSPEPCDQKTEERIVGVATKILEGFKYVEDQKAAEVEIAKILQEFLVIRGGSETNGAEGSPRTPNNTPVRRDSREFIFPPENQENIAK
jgi:hypothetical protein